VTSYSNIFISFVFNFVLHFTKIDIKWNAVVFLCSFKLYDWCALVERLLLLTIGNICYLIIYYFRDIYCCETNHSTNTTLHTHKMFFFNFNIETYEIEVLDLNATGFNNMCQFLFYASF
jgi:hypothetical protein